jgi:hypothetical protein
MNILLSGLLLACAATTVLAQSAPVRVDVASLGPKVGEHIADFRLADQDGKTWTRDSVMGPKGLMLVFSRSADWCPFCKTQFVELQARLPELRRKGLGLARRPRLAGDSRLRQTPGCQFDAVGPGLGNDRVRTPQRQVDPAHESHSVSGDLYRR